MSSVPEITNLDIIKFLFSPPKSYEEEEERALLDRIHTIGVEGIEQLIQTAELPPDSYEACYKRLVGLITLDAGFDWKHISEKAHQVFFASQHPQEDDFVLVEEKNHIEREGYVAGESSGTTSYMQFFVDWVGILSDQAGQHLKSVYGTYEKYFIDGNHPWKQKKYEIALNAIFPQDLTLEQILQKYNIAVLEGEQTSLQKKAKQILKILKGQVEPPLSNSRERYLAFIDALREVLESSEYEEEYRKKKEGELYDPAVDLLLEICYKRFKENHMYTFCESLVQGFIGSEEEYAKQFTAIEESPIEQKAPRIAIEKGKLAGTFNIFFDPLRQSNVPYVWYALPLQLSEQEVKSVQVLRFGTPTREGGPLSGATVIPEFRNFLRVAQSKGEVHLYVNLQNEAAKFIGDETNRVNAIRSLEKGFPETFYMVTLAQDSHFYKQKGEFKDLSNADGFKAAFLHQMLEEDTKTSGFYFPDSWKSDVTFQSQLEEAWHLIHATVFDGREELSVEERQDFIEIYYALLEVILIRYAKADTVNMSCKDAIDRGGKNNALFFALLLIALGKVSDPKWRRMLDVITHAPALIVKKQAIIESRRERLISAMACLLGKEVQASPLAEVVNKKYGISPDKLPEFKEDASQRVDFSQTTE